MVEWVGDNGDADIADDLRYLTMFVANLRAANTPEPDPEDVPPEPWPGD